MLLEVACFNLESCLIAQNAGAKRIELCENYSAGGLTPNQDLIAEARSNLKIDLFVMIRPRDGDFIYSDIELEEMRSQIEYCKELNCNGVVFGILTDDKKVDTEKCKELVDLAKPLSCTFHRAFDETTNISEALEDVIKCGFSRILTAGQHRTANEGISNLKQLIEKANHRIKIMPGGGIRSSNISELMSRTKATEFHSAAITGKNEIADETEIKKIIAAF